MTKKQRNILFSICALFFVLTAIIVIFYSQGFRFDFSSRKVSQTGAFYFKVLPSGAEVYLDSQLKKKTNFLFNAVYIENLLPKKYKVQIKKDGFSPWEKSLEVKEKQVTEAKNIILFSASPNFTVLSKNIGNFFFSPDEKKLIIVETKEKGWELSLYDLKNGSTSPLTGSTNFGLKTNPSFLGLSFSPDSKTALLNIGAPDSRYYLIDLSKTPADLTYLDFLGKNAEDASFPSQESQRLFFTLKGALKQGDLAKKTVSSSSLENVLAWTASGGNVYYFEKNGYLFKTDLSFAPKEKVNEIPLSPKKDAKYEISVFTAGTSFFFIKENEDLYLLNAETKAFEKLSDLGKNKGLEKSPDLNKLALFTDSEIWILFMKKQEGQPQKSAGEKLFLTRFSETIGNVFWLNPYYLIFSSGNKIKISEIDERDKLNIADLAEFKKPKIFFNQNDNKLYVLSEGALYASEDLIP